jgi:hypothetical protein
MVPHSTIIESNSLAAAAVSAHRTLALTFVDEGEPAPRMYAIVEIEDVEEIDFEPLPPEVA